MSASIDTPRTMIGSRSPGSQIQIVSPMAASSAIAVSAGTSWWRTDPGAEQPDHQHHHRAADQREQRRDLAVVDLRSGDVGERSDHLMISTSPASVCARACSSSATVSARSIFCTVERSVRSTTKLG